MLLSEDGARLVLAGLWALDGILQLWPRMFLMFMVSSVLRPPTVGEPAWLAHLTQAVLLMGTLHLVAFNVALAAIQLGLGAALAFPGRRRAWPHAASLAWCAVVWVFGEACGGLLTGAASLVTGAPGSVALYALLGWAAWPCPPGERARRRRGVAAALAGVWALGAVLQASPAFFTPAGLAALLLGNANPYQPGWLNALMRWGASLLAARPVAANLALCGLMLLVACGIALPRLRRPAVGVSLFLAAAFWVFGQAFGMLLMAMTTDPNTGPPLVALGLYAWGAGGAGSRA